LFDGEIDERFRASGSLFLYYKIVA